MRSVALIQAKHRKKAMAAVLNLQDEQRRQGTEDTDALALAYSEATVISQLWARHVAAQDQEDAEAIQNQKPVASPGNNNLNRIGLNEDRVRRVRFKKARFRKIRSISNYTQAEIHACWYTAAEYSSIRNSCAAIIRAHDNGLVPAAQGDSGEEYCLRGLESYTREGSRRKRQNRINALRVVMSMNDQNSRQPQQGMADCQEIATSYGHAATTSRRRAVNLGMQDQEEAALAHMKDELFRL